MEVKNCKGCGRLYNYIGGAYRLCPECMKKLEDQFQYVKEYIEDNPRASMRQVTEDCGVSAKQIERWIREERLTFSDESPIGIACEVCGKSIKSGRFCDRCKQSMATRLEGVYGTSITIPDEEREKRAKARMRYLDM